MAHICIYVGVNRVKGLSNTEHFHIIPIESMLRCTFTLTRSIWMFCNLTIVIDRWSKTEVVTIILLLIYSVSHCTYIIQQCTIKSVSQHVHSNVHAMPYCCMHAYLHTIQLHLHLLLLLSCPSQVSLIGQWSSPQVTAHLQSYCKVLVREYHVFLFELLYCGTLLL